MAKEMPENSCVREKVARSALADFPDVSFEELHAGCLTGGLFCAGINWKPNADFKVYCTFIKQGLNWLFL